MLEQFMQLKGKAWYELTYSSVRFSRSWNRSGGNSVKLLSCNHLCWNLKKTWSVRKIYLVLFTALFYDHWRERKKRKKVNAKTSIDGVVGKRNAAALWKQLFLVAVWFDAQQPHIISDYTIQLNGCNAIGKNSIQHTTISNTIKT